MRIPFIGQGSIGRSEYANSERMVNVFPQIDKSGKAIVALYGTPGLNLITTLSTGPIRGMLSYNDVGYIVSLGSVYSISTSYATTLLGSISTSSGRVWMATNGLVILIVDGTAGYTYTIASGVFAQITDADFPANPIACDVLDSVFVVVEGSSQRIWTSTDGSSWDPADFASAETIPDDLVGIIVDHQELVLPGKDSTEIWYNQGGAGFTFARRSMIENGCASGATVAKMDNSVFWLDNTGIVRRLSGYTPTRVSTHNQEYRIKQHTAAEIAAASAFSYYSEGHAFYQLSVGDETFVFDAATQMWHERRYLVPTSGDFTRHRAEVAMQLNGVIIVGDYSNGKVYEYDMETYTDNGDELDSVWTYRHIDNQGLRVFFDAIEIEFETGVGTLTGQGLDPQVEMQYSDNGGRTWSNWRQADMGMMGEYGARAKFYRCGSARDRVFQFRISDPVKRTIMNANLTVKKSAA